ncbi:S41 family peptidase [Enterococcus sp. AD013-P3]|uniref:S41 family peptidase n=1 Tax=Enterococcus sp. AD013-P3 TaxID=3411036 RepID=UPI003B92D133
MRIKKYLSFISGIGIIIFCSLSLFWIRPKSIDSRGYEIFSTLSQYEIINDQPTWKTISKLTSYGKKINNVDDWNGLLYSINKHSSLVKITSDEEFQTFENSNFPTISKYKNLTIINIPSAYSPDDKNFLEYYASTLAKLINHASGNIVLNLSNNHGGAREPMILGTSSLIPDGVLFNEIDNHRNRYPVLLKNAQLLGGIPGTINTLSTSWLPSQQGKILNQKVAVITNDKTSSAAESLILALRNNPNVRVFGLPSAGYTSVNMNRFFSNHNSKELWWLIYTVGYYEVNFPINGQCIFNNQPIPPDYKVDFSLLKDSDQDLLSSQGTDNLLETINNWFVSDS